MKLLALILARGGSKRVPGKNIRPLGGTPLIVWSINAAKGIDGICDILVSTDDAAIAEVARAAGALVPWLRPASLSTDTATSADVALHALEWYEAERGAVDGLLLLQPTSPFRSRDTLACGIGLFRQHGGRPVVGVSPAASHPLLCFQIEGTTMRPFVDSQPMRSQDMPHAYAINGAFYLIAPSDLRQRRSFFGGTTVPLVIDDPEESIDIDTEWDWKLAEAIYSMRQAARK